MTGARYYGGRSIAECEQYGKPCIGSEYTGDSVHRYRRYDGAKCVICGRPATDTHHWPPIGKSAHGEWTLRTPNGWHVLKPSLFALCRYHHDQFHAHQLTAEWVWDTPEDEEAWWSGELIKRMAPHSLRLYEHGKWNIYDPRYRRGFSYREVEQEDGTWKAVRGQVLHEPASASGRVASD